MKLTQAQLKGRLKNLAQKNQADARILIRIYMMERFLERVSVSHFKDNFIIKGGILVTSLIGVALRSTMDIDTTVKNLNLSEADIHQAVEEICASICRMMLYSISNRSVSSWMKWNIPVFALL